MKLNGKMLKIVSLLMAFVFTLSIGGAFAQYAPVYPAGSNSYVDAATVDLTPNSIKKPVTNATIWTKNKVVQGATAVKNAVVKGAKVVGGVVKTGYNKVDAAVTKPGQTGLPAGVKGNVSTGTGAPTQGGSTTPTQGGTAPGSSTPAQPTTPANPTTPGGTPSAGTGGKVAVSESVPSTTTTVSKTEAMNSLGLTRDSRGIYHMKGVRGAISTSKAESMIKDYVKSSSSTASSVTEGTTPGQGGTTTPGNGAGSAGQTGGGSSGQTGSTGQTGTTPTQGSGNSGTVGQSGSNVPGQSSGAAGGKKSGFLGKLKAKFGAAKAKFVKGAKQFGANVKTGYRQGVANAKVITNSTLNPFNKAAWGNVAIAAGVTVGANIISDIANGRPVDLKKAVGSVARREFAGAYIGGSLGAAGGAIAQGVLSAVPVVGPIVGAFMPALGAVVGSTMGSNLAAQTRQGRFDLAEALKSVDWAQAGGQAVGGTIGAIVGSALLPGIGTMVGGMVGSFLGGKVVGWLRGRFGNGGLPGIGGGHGGTVIHGGGNSGGSCNSGNGGSTASNSEIRAAYQAYIAAYNRLTQLMSQGKGDTPEAQRAYQDYKQAKERYERAIGKR
jgi:hypothetical protein